MTPRRHAGADAVSALVSVRLQPRAAVTELVGVRDGVLIARVTSPPVDGKANKALCRLIARHAGVAPTRVTVARGEHSRDKVVRVDGMAASDAAAMLERL